MEPFGEGLGVGAVVIEPAGLVPAGGYRCEDACAGAAGVLAGPGHGHADGQVRVCGRRAGWPGGGGDGGFQRPGEFPQRLALVVFTVAVVALADVPAAAGVAGRQAGALGGAAAEQRDRGGVQAGAAIEGRAFVVGEDGGAGFQRRVEGMEPVTPSRVRDVSESWPNSSRVASVKNSGRSSRARHKSAVSTARTGSGRGRPVRWASAASMTVAVPLRPISSAANATVSSPGSALGSGISMLSAPAGFCPRPAKRPWPGCHRRGGRSVPAIRPRGSR